MAPRAGFVISARFKDFPVIVEPFYEYKTGLGGQTSDVCSFSKYFAALEYTWRGQEHKAEFLRFTL